MNGGRALAALAIMTAGILRAEIIDRMVITVGRQVITQSQLDEELRVTAFLNLVPIDTSIEAQRKAADRLVEQTLVNREMELSRYPEPTPDAVEKYRSQIVKQYGGEAAFQAALKRDLLTPATLNRHLVEQLTVLRFLDYRFRPEVDVTDHDIADAYHLYVEEWKRTKPGPPPSLDRVRESLESQIYQGKINGEFSRWMEETRKQVPVNYLDSHLR